MMLVTTTEWYEILVYNLRIVGALWAAWAGGAASVLHDDDLRSAHIIDVEEGEDEDGEPIRKRHLSLVP